MKNQKLKASSASALRVMLLLLLAVGLLACETMPKSETATETKQAATESAAAPAEAPASEASGSEAPAATSAEPAAEEAKIPAIAESCKDEPYVGYEKQALDSMAKGLAATEAGSYGVGFRDRDEHKKWTEIHNQLFAKVNESCQALSDCAKQNPKDKDAKCAGQAKTFEAWQTLAGKFADKAKLSETTQPPIICSFQPNLADPERCFLELASNVEAACDTQECKELSNCWRGVGFLDAAIQQSERTCAFAREPLDKCRGYVEAKERREKKFEQCKNLQGGMDITVMPAL